MTTGTKLRIGDRVKINLKGYNGINDAVIYHIDTPYNGHTEYWCCLYRFYNRDNVIVSIDQIVRFVSHDYWNEKKLTKWRCPGYNIPLPNGTRVQFLHKDEVVEGVVRGFDLIDNKQRYLIEGQFDQDNKAIPSNKWVESTRVTVVKEEKRKAKKTVKPRKHFLAPYVITGMASLFAGIIFKEKILQWTTWLGELMRGIG